MAGVALVAVRVRPDLGPWVVALAPVPAMVDWAVTTLGDRRGTNAGRTLTGGLLGVGYGVGLARFAVDPGPWPVVAAVGRGTPAAVGLVVASPWDGGDRHGDGRDGGPR